MEGALFAVQNQHLIGPYFSKELDEYPSRVDHKVDGVFASSLLPITSILQKYFECIHKSEILICAWITSHPPCHIKTPPCCFRCRHRNIGLGGSSCQVSLEWLDTIGQTTETLSLAPK